MDSPSVRMFVDENGNADLRKDLSNPSNRFLCLTGIIMKLSAHEVLTEHFNILKMKYFGRTDIVLHRREIISAEPSFEILKDQSIRNQFNDDLIFIIQSLKYRVISIVIDKKCLVDKYGIIMARDPYALALEYLMQRYQYWMQDFSISNGPIYGDILAESRGKREDNVTKETYTAIYSGLGYNPLKNADSYYSSKEIKLKKKKCNIVGLQFVDLLSHPARRFILASFGLSTNIKVSSYEQRIVDILVKDKFRRDTKGIMGVGAVLFPRYEKNSPLA